MKPICFIPVFSGNEVLQNKNMLYLDDEPLVFHTIKAALDSECFSNKDIYAVTDSILYKDICETKGINTLMTENQGFMNLIFSEKLISSFDDNQVIMILDAKYPLRTANNIKEALELYKAESCDSVVSFSKIEKYQSFISEIDDLGFSKNINGDNNISEDLYIPNGAIYITSKENYVKNNGFFSEKTKVYVMNREDSLSIDNLFDFNSANGIHFFDTKKREGRNKKHFMNLYKALAKNRMNNKVILGDSRLVDIEVAGYDNLSISGVTLATMRENLTTILEKKIDKVVISLGVNDLITKYDLNVIKDNFSEVVKQFVALGTDITLTNIVYTLLRERVSNSDISEINNYIYNLAREYNLNFIDINTDLSKDDNLRFEYTYDGLHFNAVGEKILFDKIIENI